MSNEIVVPDYIKALTNDGGVSQEEGLISRGGSVPRISLKGFKFRFIEDGEEVSASRDPIHMVILGAQPERGMTKTYYEGEYNPEDTDPPKCSSSDGVRPDAWVDDPESDMCSSCPKGKWGSAKSATGKKAKACRDSKRLMVVRPDEVEDGIVYILNVTVSSLRALSEYGKMLVSNKLPMSAVITQFSFADSDYPQLDLKFAGVLKEDVFKKSVERSAKREWDEISHQPIIEDKSDKRSKPQLTDTSSSEKTEGTPVEMGDTDSILDQWD